MTVPSGLPIRQGSPDELQQKIHFDNLFRLGISGITLSACIYLWAYRVIPNIHLLLTAFTLYSLAYLLGWVLIYRLPALLLPLDYFLTACDIGAITAGIISTGHIHSPLFYLYAIPLLVEAFHFNLRQIQWNAAWSVGCYLALVWSHHAPLSPSDMSAIAGQSIFLMMVIASSIVLARSLKRKEEALAKNMQAMESNVAFLNELNALTLELPMPQLQGHMSNRLNHILKPFKTHARLWVHDEYWRTLKGVGEHPALRPGSPAYLPVRACPAFALRKPFSYEQSKGDPCPSEQFNYNAHLCLPVFSEKETFGVLFLGTYEKSSWDQEDIHFFETLAHSVALTLQRKALFERLQEKIKELNFSFEVGVAALATFVGSTQSIDETTVHILDNVLAILKVDRASLMLWNPQVQQLQTQWVRGTDFRIHSAMSVGMGEGMAGWALKMGEPYWAEYAMGDPHYRPSAQPIKSLLCVPVFTVDRKPLGVINAVTVSEARVFTEREIIFLKSFGQQAALAIENAQLHHKNRSHIEQLKELDKMKSQFLSLVSHDLRGPLTGVRGYCEILKQQSSATLTPSQMNLISQLERQVDLQERMVNDLLDFARMEKGRLSIQPDMCAIDSLLKEEVEKSQIEAQERDVFLTLALPQNRPFPLIPADQDRIRQVIWNLIHNSLKFTPEQGRIVVRGQFDEDNVTIEVADTGIGLSPETQERIFDKFFQITPGGSKGARGLGLGLAICKEIVLAHRGKIRAHSAGLGQGSTMSFSLPIRSPLQVKSPANSAPALSTETISRNAA